MRYKSISQETGVTTLFSCAFLSIALLLLGGSRSDAAPPRPNILYLYVDDMGWGSIGPNGQWERRAKGLPSVRTPNLDAIAKTGLNFRRGYGCHVCSPARSSQQSGFHQGHTFADRNDPNNAKKAMRADDILIGDALSDAGYVTGYWGKWGYGGSKDRENPTIDNVQTLPTSHGYQHVLAELHHVRAHTFFQPTLWSAPAPAGSIGGLHLKKNSMRDYQSRDDYPAMPALQNHPGYPEVAYCDDSYAFAALDFIRTQGEDYNRTGQPFFGLLAVQIPHAPFGEIEALPDWDRHYQDDPLFDDLADQTRQWAAMVTRIDGHFGNLLAALEDPNNDGDSQDSIADNTLVIFQSDNGGPGGRNREQLDANGGLQGVKGKIQEGGIRVPLLMRWPARINSDSKLKAGTSTDLIVDVTDLLPTFCELAGVSPPLGVDGVSIAPTLIGEGHQRKRDFIIHEAGNGQSIIEGDWKLVRHSSNRSSLFHIARDHAEQNDVSQEHPRRVQRMMKLLLDERVAEPRGFANTYHRWTGGDGAETSAADNWTDYEYSNAGITYMTDTGSPSLSWVAQLKNDGDDPNTAIVDSDLEFLALAIGGGVSSANQTLSVGQGKHVHGRNEIRVMDRGVLSMSGGTVSSMRWVDVEENGIIVGSGTLDSAVFNRGTIKTSSTVQVTGPFRQSSGGILSVTVTSPDQAGLHVEQTASLQGKLQINDQSPIESGARRLVLKAKRLSGRFANPDDLVITAEGTRYKITYTKDSVIATAL